MLYSSLPKKPVLGQAWYGVALASIIRAEVSAFFGHTTDLFRPKDGADVDACISDASWEHSKY